MRPIAIPTILRPFASRFAAAGYRCFLVGGAVRDLLRRQRPGEWDVATNATPPQVQHLFRRTISTGIAHGTLTVLFRSLRVEVTSFRIEEGYSDGRRPDKVYFSASIEDDLGRRDFTINGMALDLIGGDFLDLYDGRADLRHGVVRAIGSPEQRFSEDGLRILRAVRFACTLGFTIEIRTAAAIRSNAAMLQRIAAERVRAEIERILDAARPSVGLRLLRDLGLLAIILPELQCCVGVAQDDGTVGDLYEHLILACDGAPHGNRVLRMAALLHDIGKPGTQQTTAATGAVHFHGHEQLSARLAEQIMHRLRFPKAFLRRVCHLIEHHMFNYTSQWSDAGIRRFIVRVGADYIDDLITLRLADRYGKYGRSPAPGQADRLLEELGERVHVQMAARASGTHALSLRDLALNGHDLQQELAISDGPLIGHLLTMLLETVLHDPEQNTRPTLLRIARNYWNERIRTRGQR